MKTRPANHAFTLLELMTVLLVISVLTAMVVGVAGMVSTKASKARAKVEIAMLSQAADAYKNDNGNYPRTDETDKLDPRKDFSPTSKKYEEASLAFYRELTGDKGPDRAKPDGIPDADTPVYLKEFDLRIVKRSQSTQGGSNKTEVKYFQDPFGFPYGYSTAAAKQEQEYNSDLRKNGTAERKKGEEAEGFNTTTFDLWSTASSNLSTPPSPGKDLANEQAKWVKNW